MHRPFACASCFICAAVGLGLVAPAQALNPASQAIDKAIHGARAEGRMPGKTLVERARIRDLEIATELRQAWRARHNTKLIPTTPPAITFGKLLTTALNVQKAPGGPAISVKYKTNSSGLAYIDAVFASSTTEQGGEIFWGPEYLAPPTTGGTVKIAAPLTLGVYSAPGTWSLTYLTIFDNAGNTTSYDSTSLATLFKQLNFTVTNKASPDVNAPLGSGGSVLTPIVHLSDPSPLFAASVNGSDDVSGVVSFYLDVVSPSGSYYSGEVDPGAPIKNGTLTNYVSLSGASETGQWTIDYYYLCDLADNCVESSGPSDIQSLFGTTTFQVQQ